MSFDPITMSLAANKAKADLAESGAIGSVIPAKKYTFDGNIEGKPVMDMGDFVMVQISSDVVDVYTVQTITVNNLTVSVDELNVGNFDEFGVIAVSEIPYVILPKTGGVFVHYKEGVDVVKEVACKETIVPIDPKYLPAGIGGGLPVVELSTEPTSEGAPLTEEETAQVVNALATSNYAVVSIFDTDGYAMSAIFRKVLLEEGVESLQGLISTRRFIVAVADGTGIFFAS